MAIENFDPLDYFKHLAETNRMCRENGFKPVFCSGPENLEGVMAEYRDTANFVIIDDTTDNNVHFNKPGWFRKTVYTVWIVAAYDYNDMEQRKERMNLCREIYRQFLSRALRDRSSMRYGEAMYYFGTSNVYYKELGRYSLNGATGLYFMIENDIPEDLTYKNEEWS